MLKRSDYKWWIGVIDGFMMIIHGLVRILTLGLCWSVIHSKWNAYLIKNYEKLSRHPEGQKFDEDGKLDK